MGPVDVRVNDSCHCGAEFSMLGFPSFIEERHNAWLNAHIVCRAKTFGEKFDDLMNGLPEGIDMPPEYDDDTNERSESLTPASDSVDTSAEGD